MLEFKLLKSALPISEGYFFFEECLYEPLALRVEVDTTYRSLHLVETNIVEPLEAGARDCSDPMVRDEEIFLPSHEHVLALSEIAVREIGSFGLFGQRLPRRKSGPMVYVGFLVGAPCFVASLERVLGADDLSFEKRGQGGMVFCETCRMKRLELSCIQSTMMRETNLECEGSRRGRTRPCPRA